MNRLRIAVVAAALVCAAVSAPALAGHEAFERARVVDVQPIREVVRYPVSRRQCWTDEVEERHVRHEIGGRTLIGAIIGGVVGNQLARPGDRGTRHVATAAGAIIGGAVGNDMEPGYREQPRWRERRHCRVSDDYREEEHLVGYRVTYRYHGRLYTSDMDHDPGRFVQVRVDVSPAE